MFFRFAKHALKTTKIAWSVNQATTGFIFVSYYDIQPIQCRLYSISVSQIVGDIALTNRIYLHDNVRLVRVCAHVRLR